MMLGYYNLEEQEINELPKNSINIEDNLYEICCPLVTNDTLPSNIKCLYETLNIPILKTDELKDYDDAFYKDLSKYLKTFSDYLKLNIEIELLEEGKIGHTLRVGKYASELCKLANLNKELTRKIYVAALFHDIGKINVPKKIISKPGRLTEKEFEIMKKHSQYGKEILDDFLDNETLDMILTHHERMDKSGYPLGIVPSIGAKIIGIADSYDAMLSNRVYKKNKTLKAAQEELIRCTLDIKNGGKGILYDEDLVRKFVSLHGYKLLVTKEFNKHTV